MAFPSNPTDGQTFSENGANYTYNASQGIWVQTNVASGGGSGGSGGGGGGGGLVAPSQHASFDVLVSAAMRQDTKYILTGPDKAQVNVQFGVFGDTTILATNVGNTSGISQSSTSIVWEGQTYQQPNGGIIFSNAGKYRMLLRSELRYSTLMTNFNQPVYNIRLGNVDAFNYSPVGTYVLDGGTSSNKMQSYVYSTETILDVAQDDVLTVAIKGAGGTSGTIGCQNYFSFHFESLF